MKTIFILILVSSIGLASEMGISRIQSHLRLVESLLRLQDTSRLDEDKKLNRKKNLDNLNVYWKRGEFPQNISRPNSRHPFFIDHRGIPCAVGFLIIQSGYEELALRIARTQNELFLEEIVDPELSSWVEESGLSPEELRLIQPSYPYEKKFQDPILEAAFLFDLENFKALVKTAGLKSGTMAYENKMSEALRVVAPEIVWKPLIQKKINDEEDSGEGIYYEPPPRKNDGKAFLNFLIQQKADPNYKSKNQASLLFISKDPEVRKLLKKFGAYFSEPERLLVAIEEKDLETIKNLLETSDYNPYGNQSDLPAPLWYAFSKIPYDAHETAELAKNPDLSFKIVYTLMTHPSKKISLNEVGENGIPSVGRILSISRPSISKLLVQEFKLESKLEAESLMDFLRDARYGYFPDFRHPSKIIVDSVKRKLLAGKVLLKESDTLKIPLGYDLTASNKVVEEIEFLVELGASAKEHSEDLIKLIDDQKTVTFNEPTRRIIKTLIKAGAPLNDYSSGQSALNGLIIKSDPELIKLALDNGASINPTNEAMCKPLAVAIAKKDIPSIKLLLKYKANPNLLTVVDRCDKIKINDRELKLKKIKDMPMDKAVKDLLSKVTL